jgi:hypothetical protein
MVICVFSYILWVYKPLGRTNFVPHLTTLICLNLSACLSVCLSLSLSHTHTHPYHGLLRRTSSTIFRFQHKHHFFEEISPEWPLGSPVELSLSEFYHV